MERLAAIDISNRLEYHSPMIARDVAYLAWRYRDHPIHRYQAWLVTANRWFRTQVVGWLVSRVLAQGPPLLVDGYFAGYGLLTTLLSLDQHHACGSDGMRAKAIADEAHTTLMRLDQLRWQAWIPEDNCECDGRVIAGQFLYPGTWRPSACRNRHSSVIFTPGDTDVW